jgi:nitrite reductase/ring-hydroxylating ferredoxin subunit
MLDFTGRLLYAFGRDYMLNRQNTETLMPDAQKTLKRGFFRRLFGRPATEQPADESCWSCTEGRIVVDLDRAPELKEPGGAIRLESPTCPERVLVIHGDNGRYHAFRNSCTHAGRRLDPVPGASTVQCCSVGRSTYDYDGNILRGSAKENIKPFPVQLDDRKLTVTIG